MEVVVLVAVSIGKTAAVRDHRVIQQRAVAFLHRFELVQQVGELLDVIAVDLRDLFDLLRIAAMVSQSMMRVADPDLRAVGPRTLLDA